MVPLIQTPPDGRQGVGCGQEEELGHVEHVQELGAVAYIEPHPVSVRLQTDGLEAKEFEEVASTACPPVRVRLVLVEEFGVVLLRIVIVRVSRRARLGPTWGVHLI